MNYTVTVYDSEGIVLETHWFNSHVEARIAKHKLVHGYHGKNVTIEIEEVV